MGAKSSAPEDPGNTKYADTPADFDAILAEAGDKTVFVDFTATWCPPCKMIGPKFVEFSKEFTDAVFIKVDVDKNKPTAQKHGIRAMPTFMAFKNGQKLDEFCGADAGKLKQMIEKHK